MKTLLFALSSLAVAACSAPGTRPHEMSATQHEREAKAHSQEARAHAGRYDPKATEDTQRCRPPTLPVTTGNAGESICWTAVRNPTAEHERMAAEHRKIASEHRAASEALRQAEVRACAGISPDDRDISPFERLEDIGGVQAITDRIGTPRVATEVLVGARITFRAVPGLTAEWLQRTIDCHLARNATLGHVAPQMPNCPLVPRGVRATVSSAGDGFAVAVEASDRETAREVLTRAERLLAGARQPEAGK